MACSLRANGGVYGGTKYGQHAGQSNSWPLQVLQLASGFTLHPLVNLKGRLQKAHCILPSTSMFLAACTSLSRMPGKRSMPRLTLPCSLHWPHSRCRVPLFADIAPHVLQHMVVRNSLVIRMEWGLFRSPSRFFNTRSNLRVGTHLRPWPPAGKWAPPTATTMGLILPSPSPPLLLKPAPAMADAAESMNERLPR